jgi:hypothetical protein
MTDSISDDWILLPLWLQPLLITLNPSVIAIPHTFTNTVHTNPLCPNLHSQFTADAPSRCALVPIRLSTAHTQHNSTRKSSNLQVSISRVQVSGVPYLLYNFGTDHAQKTQPFYCCMTSQFGVPRDLYPGRPLARWLLPSTDHTENLFCPCLPKQLPSNELQRYVHYCCLYSLLRECLWSHCLATMTFLYCYRNGPYITIFFGYLRLI